MMNRLKTELRILVVTGVTILGLVTGCALFQRGSKAEYNTLAAVGYTVDNAVIAYDAGVLKGIVPTNNVPNVSKAYNEFQAVYREALKAAEGGATNIAPADLISAEAIVLNAVGGIP